MCDLSKSCSLVFVCPCETVLCVRVPAAHCGLEQGGDPHTEEDGPYELAGGPLIEADAHRISEEERHRDSSTETSQVVLQRQKETVSKYVCLLFDLTQTVNSHHLKHLPCREKKHSWCC